MYFVQIPAPRYYSPVKLLHRDLNSPDLHQIDTSHVNTPDFPEK